ncbi:MAG: fibronectin type III domain-containing protein, partial [Planctomycetes bacterium]|nr:fibronectin type III domain-containing protein [Planctomycetota bacterium]
AAAANPAIGWMSYAIGDPLYAPTRAKTLVRDTQNPGFAAGSPTLVMNERNGCAVKILVADSPEPDVAKVRIDYGTTTAYGQSVTSVGYFRRHLLSLAELPASTLIHYRVTLTDPVGNTTTTADQTVTTPAQTPHGGTPWPIPGTIACANFDDGGEGVAYHDTRPDNYVPNQYRSDTGVEVSYWTPYVVTYWGTEAGEWLEYTVNATQSGTYSIDVAFENGDGGKFRIASDGVDQTGQLTTMSSSAGFTVTATGVSLSAGGHVIRISMDVAGGNGNIGQFATMTFTRTGGPSGDTTPPVISAVASGSITTTGATITWTTNEASDSQVQYGTTTGYGSSSTLNTSLVTTHSIVLSGLSAGTLYHYRVLSRDAAGNLATSGDNTFTTSAPADTTPPVISAIAAGSITATSAVITWTTNEAADSQVQYGTTTAYGSQTTLNATKVTSHSVALSGLTASTLYHVRVLSRDAAGNLATSGDVTFTTTSTPDTTPPVISGVTPGSITATSVVITWTTNEPSSSQVQFGLTTSYGSTTVLDASMITSHSVAITGLAPSTVYHVRVLSRDAAGNLTTSGDVIVTTAAPATSSISAGDEDGRHQGNQTCGIGTGGLALLGIGLLSIRRRRG